MSAIINLYLLGCQSLRETLLQKHIVTMAQSPLSPLSQVPRSVCRKWPRLQNSVYKSFVMNPFYRNFKGLATTALIIGGPRYMWTFYLRFHVYAIKIMAFQRNLSSNGPIY